MMILLDGQEGALDDVIGCQIFGTHSMNGAQFRSAAVVSCGENTIISLETGIVLFNQNCHAGL